MTKREPDRYFRGQFAQAFPSQLRNPALRFLYQHDTSVNIMEKLICLFISVEGGRDSVD